MKKMFLIILLNVFIVSLTMLYLKKSWALDAGAESVENYSGCGCSSGNLHYCNDQACLFLR